MKMIKNASAVMLLLASAVYADVPPATQHEVQHLINFVTRTSCQIIRNGSTHDGAEAVKHIQQKYDYYRDDIATTEQFIEYSATKSMLSAQYYLVKCGKQRPVKTKDWLLQELKKYRAQETAQK